MSLDVLGAKGLTVPAYVRVALCPIGSINGITFKKFAQKIQKYSIIPISNLTRFHNDNVKSPFKRHNWKNGVIRMMFVDGTTGNNSQFNEFQQHRKIHICIGIMSCMSEGNVRIGYEKYLNVLKQFNDICASRCFAVEPLETQQDVELKDLVMIPNQDEKRLDFYIETLMNDLVLYFFQIFEKRAADPKSVMKGSILSINNQSTETSQRLKKISAEKYVADYCLLAGSADDAIIHYQSVIDQCRMLNENLILAAAIQGMACALCLNAENKLKDPEVVKSIVDLYVEAVKIYSQESYIELHVEALLRMGDFNATCGIQTRRAFALDCVTLAVQASSGMNAQEQIIALGEAARICLQMGFHRKYAFFLYQAFTLHHKLYNDPIAYRLCALCLKGFDIPLEFKNNRWHVLPKKRKGWSSIQQRVLKDLLKVAFAVQDYIAAVQIILYLLVEFREELDEFQQRNLFSKLKLTYQQVPPIPDIALTSLPLLHSIKPLRLPSYLEPIEKKEKQKDVFIFKAFRKKDKEDQTIKWVKDELAKVQVVLSNPYFQELKLNSISLKLDAPDDTYEVYETKGTILPTDTLSVTVLIRPLQVGQINIKSIIVQIEDVLPVHFEIPYDVPPKQQPKIIVVDSLPLLHVNLNMPTISLYDGECVKTHCMFNNMGSIAINYINVNVQNSSKNKIEMDTKEIEKHLPLQCGQSIEVPIYVTGKWNDNNEDEIKKVQEVILEISYGNGNKYLRKIRIPMHLVVNLGLVVENCMTVDEDNSREIVANVTNYSPFPFVLLHSDNSSNVHQFDKEIPIGPLNSKLLLINDVKLPYTAKLKNYTDQIARTLKWKSSVNTFGAVGAEYLKQDQNQNIPSDLVDAEVALTVKNNGVDYSEEKTITVKLASCVQLLSSIKGNRKYKVEIIIFQHAENGIQQPATPQQVMCSGKLVSETPENFEKFENIVNVFFLTQGTYNVVVKCSDVVTGTIVHQPLGLQITATL